MAHGFVFLRFFFYIFFRFPIISIISARCVLLVQHTCPRGHEHVQVDSNMGSKEEAESRASANISSDAHDDNDPVVNCRCPHRYEAAQCRDLRDMRDGAEFQSAKQSRITTRGDGQYNCNRVESRIDTSSQSAKKTRTTKKEMGRRAQLLHRDRDMENDAPQINDMMGDGTRLETVEDDKGW